MKLQVLSGTLGVAFAIVSLVAVGCERREGKIILHEDKAKEKTGQAVEKVGEGIKELGEKTEELGEKAKERAKADRTDAAEPGGVGGGPRAPASADAEPACDAAATECPP